MDILPLFLSEATLSLYPTDAAGNPIMGNAVWIGALATGLGLRLGFEGELSFASGDRFKTDHHVDEHHVIEINRNWFTRKNTPGEQASPQRNTNYVLDIIWSDKDELGIYYWHRRQYFGVTARTADLASEGTKHFSQPQVFRAQYFIPTGGIGAPPDTVFSPTTPGLVQDVLFIREDAYLPGEYFLGTYRWNVPRTILSAKAIGLASQDVPTVLTLEVNGVATGKTITLPAGASNAEVSGENTTINLGVNGGAVRWKITSGPADPSSAAWKTAIVMEVQ